MVNLAEPLSPHWRVGAAWLYLSADGNLERNREIRRQRLSPEEVVELDKPDLSYDEWMEEKEHNYPHMDEDDRLFAPCIAIRRDFHVDPHGQMTFCCFIKDPALRYDLREGTFRECWEAFIPSLTDLVRGGREYVGNCGSCKLRHQCRWCPVYGYLEHRSFSAKVDYLCAVAMENRRFKENWKKNHRRFYQIAGITIRVDSDLPITDETFLPKFRPFEVGGPGEDTISITHHFFLPDIDGKNLGREVYRKPPWAIYRKGDSWIYVGISPSHEDGQIHQVAWSNHSHSRLRIYNPSEKIFLKGGLHSLTLFPTDQILLARALADRGSCYLHASGVVMNGKGLLFAGHSEAGKSTLAMLLKDRAEILCDDRIIVRNHSGKIRIHGTWSHGDVEEISPGSAPLSGIFFLEKSDKNRLISLENTQEVIAKLLENLIRPFETADWWEKTLMTVGIIAGHVPC